MAIGAYTCYIARFVTGYGYTLCHYPAVTSWSIRINPRASASTDYVSWAGHPPQCLMTYPT